MSRIQIYRVPCVLSTISTVVNVSVQDLETLSRFKVTCPDVLLSLCGFQNKINLIRIFVEVKNVTSLNVQEKKLTNTGIQLKTINVKLF